MSGSAATHSEAGSRELLTDRAPMSAQLGTDLAQGATPGRTSRCTFNVHGATATAAACRGLDISEKPKAPDLTKQLALLAPFLRPSLSRSRLGKQPSMLL